MPLALVNPEVVSHSKEECTAEEGCLSVPAIYGEVTRPVNIVLRARLLSGEPVQVECGGMLSRCIQHEIDHLDGVLFIDKLPRAERKRVAAEVSELEKSTQANLSRAL
jgi:peptide deformylase